MKFLKFAVILPIVLFITILLFLFFTPGGEYNDTVYNKTQMFEYNKITSKGIVTKEDANKTVSDLSGISGTDGESTVNSLACPYGDLIVKNSTKHKLDPLLIAAIVSQESDFGRDAGMSSGGALGLIQVKVSDGPIQQLKQVGLWDSDMTENMEDPDNNLNVACKYIRYGYDYFVVPAGYGSDYGALAAGYNGWWPRTLKYNPPCYPKSVSSENWNYYHQVAARYEAYKNGSLKVGEKGKF